LTWIPRKSPGKVAPSRHQVKILNQCEEARPIGDLMEIAKQTDRAKFRNQAMNPLLKAGLPEMTIPDKPRSSKQKYRLTEKGLAALASLERLMLEIRP
jgi:ATP-dependent DNA helicase RecG